MKILHLIDSEGFYGAETVLVDLVAEQNRQGIRATIMNLRPCRENEPSIKVAAKKLGLEFEVIALKAGLDIQGAREIIRFAQHNHFDILHCHGYKANILIGLMPKWLRKLPVVTTLHGWCCTKRFTKLWLFEQLDRLSLRFMDAVVVVNKAMLKHPFLCNSRLKIQVVNNGIPSINFLPPASLEQDIVDFCQRDGLVLGAIGRLSKEKGFDLLLEVLPKLEKQGLDPYLVILGEGEERLSLELLIEKYDIKNRVFLAGYRDGARNYLPLFDQFIMPSLTEGLPITLLEAMQAEVPIVATAVGGIPEVLKDGKAGTLLPPGDIDMLKNSIAKIADNKQRKNRILKEAVSEVSENYSDEAMSRKYYAIYQQVSFLD